MEKIIAHKMLLGLNLLTLSSLDEIKIRFLNKKLVRHAGDYEILILHSDTHLLYSLKGLGSLARIVYSNEL